MAKEAADIVILDDNFSSIVKCGPRPPSLLPACLLRRCWPAPFACLCCIGPDAALHPAASRVVPPRTAMSTSECVSSPCRSVLWGRAVFQSIQKFLQFQLTVNVVAMLASFVGSVIGGRIPLNVLQVGSTTSAALPPLPEGGSCARRPPSPCCRHAGGAARKTACSWVQLMVKPVAGLSLGPTPASAPAVAALQLLWVNMIMDTMGALALATEDPNPEVLKEKVRGSQSATQRLRCLLRLAARCSCPGVSVMPACLAVTHSARQRLNFCVPLQPHGRSDPLITKKMWKHIIVQSIYQLFWIFFFM